MNVVDYVLTGAAISEPTTFVPFQFDMQGELANTCIYGSYAVGRFVEAHGYVPEETDLSELNEYLVEFEEYDLEYTQKLEDSSTDSAALLLFTVNDTRGRDEAIRQLKARH